MPGRARMGVICTTCLGLCVGPGACSKPDVATPEEELAVRFPDVQAEADSLSARFEFNQAEAALWAFEDELRQAGLEYTPLHARLKDELSKLNDKQREHRRLLAAGHVVLEGRVVSKTERDEILAQRKAAQEAQAAEAQRLLELQRQAEQDAEREAEALEAAKRIRPRSKVEAYVEESQRRHRLKLPHLQRMIAGAGGDEQSDDQWRQQLAQAEREGPQPVILGSAFPIDGSTWGFQFGRIGYLGDAALVIDIVDSWTAIVNVSGAPVFLARFGTLSLSVGKSIGGPAPMMEVVGTRIYQPASGSNTRVYVLEPFNIAPFMSEMPASTLME